YPQLHAFPTRRSSDLVELEVETTELVSHGAVDRQLLARLQTVAGAGVGPGRGERLEHDAVDEPGELGQQREAAVGEYPRLAGGGPHQGDEGQHVGAPLGVEARRGE